MKTVKQLLQEADPLHDELTDADDARHSRRQALIAAAATGARGSARPRFGLARLALVTLIAIVVLFLGSRMWPRTSFESYAAVRFEVRLAEDHPEQHGLREAMIGGQLIYLHEEVVVSNGDIARAEVIPGNNPSEFWVSVEFNESGALKMLQATAGHIGRRMAILVDDEVVVAPVVRSPIGSSAVINGNFLKEQAERIVNGIGAN